MFFKKIDYGETVGQFNAKHQDIFCPGIFLRHWLERSLYITTFGVFWFILDAFFSENIGVLYL